MQKNRMKKVMMVVLLFCVSCTSVSAYEMEVLDIEQSIYQVETRTDDYIWKYKIIGGKLYKRLYNTRTGKFVGDWILA